jgi:hypothetical protein
LVFQALYLLVAGTARARPGACRFGWILMLSVKEGFSATLSQG